MVRPKFDAEFFDRHQERLVRFANSWIGRRFFDFVGGFGLRKDIRVMALYPNAVSYDWKVEDGRLVKTTCFSTDNHYQKKLEHAYRFLTMMVPQGLAWKMLQPSGALMTLPMVALTVSTFYPDAAPESTSVDGYVRKAQVGQTWATIHDATDGNVASDSATNFEVAVRENGVANSWDQISRSVLLFDTDALPDTDVISAASISIYGFNAGTENDFNDTVNIVSATPASNTAVGTADFDEFGTTKFSAGVAISAWNETGYNEHVFNASGIAAIVVDGVSKFGWRSEKDIDDDSTSGGGEKDTFLYAITADNGSNKPKLVVTHSAPWSPRHSAGGAVILSGFPHL